MIYNFPIPTIEDDVNFPDLIKKPGQPEWIKEVIEYNDCRKKFKAVLTEAYLKNKSYGELFSQYKDTVEAYLNVNVDLVSILLSFSKTLDENHVQI
jgi:hypothetical protein